MNNYVKIYKNVVDDYFCKRIIDKFESNSQQHETHKDNSMSFTQINIMDSRWNNWKQETEAVYNILMNCVSLYQKEYKPIWPEKYAFAAIRIKRYLPDGNDCFNTHVDVKDNKTSIRFLVFFLYLDDNLKGQTIIKPRGNKIISKCKKGNVLVFPPMWTHPHSGEKPLNKPKYIIGSYLHYV